MMGLNVHLKSQKRKVVLVLANYATRYLKHVGRGDHLVFQPYDWEIYIIAF